MKCRFLLADGSLTLRNVFDLSVIMYTLKDGNVKTCTGMGVTILKLSFGEDLITTLSTIIP